MRGAALTVVGQALALQEDEVFDVDALAVDVLVRGRVNQDSGVCPVPCLACGSKIFLYNTQY